MYEKALHQTPVENKRFLITGGAGFIGSNITAYLLQHGAKVRVFDNLATGNIENLKEFQSHPNFDFLEGDLRNTQDCAKACYRHRCCLPSGCYRFSASLHKRSGYYQ
jgi:UDP-N-acetylglucosamine 4-epimerase